MIKAESKQKVVDHFKRTQQKQQFGANTHIQSKNEDLYFQGSYMSAQPAFHHNQSQKVSQIKFEEQAAFSRKNKTQQISDLLIDAPAAPLRFSQVQKCIEVMKRAIPEVLDDTLIDRMYAALFTKVNFSSSQLNFSLQLNSSKKRADPYLAKKYQKHYNFDSLSQDKIYEQKMQLFKKYQQTNARQKSEKSTKRKSNGQKKAKLLKQIWNAQIQADFIKLYNNNNRFNEIKTYLAIKYPEFKDSFTYTQLRCEGYKIMRTAVRKLYYVIANFKEPKLPELLKMTEMRSNFIFYYKQGAIIRRMLTDFYLSQEINREFLTKLIITINNLCIEMEQDQVVLLRMGHLRERRRVKPFQGVKQCQKSEQAAAEKDRSQFQDEFYGQEDQKMPQC